MQTSELTKALVGCGISLSIACYTGASDGPVWSNRPLVSLDTSGGASDSDVVDSSSSESLSDGSSTGGDDETAGFHTTERATTQEDTGLDNTSGAVDSSDSVSEDTGPLLDSGGTADVGTEGSGTCVAAQLLWFDDFETGDYSRWTSHTYDADWDGGHCHDNGFSIDRSMSGSQSHRSDITCASSQNVHRGYGGVQFRGDQPVDVYDNQGEGIDAPFGIVNSYWSWIDAPYDFQDGRWFSFFTVDSDCAWGEQVITLGLEDATKRLTPAHIKSTGGTVAFEPDAPAFPKATWVRTTIYLNYVEGVMHVWQDGHSVLHATFQRPTTDLCQFHWGAYAEGSNDDVVLFEDDNDLWKLQQPWTDFSVEPWLAHSVSICD